MRIRESTIWLVAIGISAILLLGYFGGFLDSPNWALLPLICPAAIVIIVVVIALVFRIKGERS